MRLYAASDLHGKYRYGETIKDGIRRSRADAVVLAGDILNYRRNPDLLRFWMICRCRFFWCAATAIRHSWRGGRPKAGMCAPCI
jgi:hypothetical protein